MSHGARVITLSPRDQNLLRLVLLHARESAIPEVELRQGDLCSITIEQLEALKERLGL